MEFVVALLQRLAEDQQVSLSEAASETYYATLQVTQGCSHCVELHGTRL